MADKSTQPPEIKSLSPRGINLRADKNALPDGFCDREHGMWPKRTGSRSRLLGKTLMRQVGDEVIQLHQAFVPGTPVFAQIGDTLQFFTLDALLNREEDTSLTASVGNEEDQVGMAIITQTEANTVPGGSIDGFLSGSSAAAADTFFGRRLTNMWVNETDSGLLTVNTFTASTGGSGAASTEGTFVLVPGTYRMEITCVFGNSSGGSLADVIWGLYNVTSSAFEVYAGTTQPILGTSSLIAVQEYGNVTSKLSAAITVSSSNKTYAIRQKGSTTGGIRDLEFGGTPTGMTGANVNAAAAKNTYTTIKIWRFT